MGLFNKGQVEELRNELKDLNERFNFYYEEYRKLKAENTELKEIMKTHCYLKPKQRQITKEQIEYIRTLRAKEGMSYKNIAKETGWSKSTVYRVINSSEFN